MAYVYLHKRLDTNVIFYVGIGSDKKYKRAHQKARRTIFWKNITNKTDYEIIIHKDNLTIEESCEEEIRLIKLYGRRDLGLGELVNMDDGGKTHNGRKPSPEIKKKISEKLKEKNYKTTSKINSVIVKEICEKIMIGFKQKDICNLYPIVSKGMFYQIYYKKTWKEITTNYDFPKIKNDYIISEEHKKKISKTLKGKYYGETIKIKCLNDNKKFNSISDAAKYYNLTYAQIFNVLNKNKEKYKNSIKLNFISINEKL